MMFISHHIIFPHLFHHHIPLLHLISYPSSYISKVILPHASLIFLKIQINIIHTNPFDLFDLLDYNIDTALIVHHNKVIHNIFPSSLISHLHTVLIDLSHSLFYITFQFIDLRYDVDLV